MRVSTSRSADPAFGMAAPPASNPFAFRSVVVPWTKPFKVSRDLLHRAFDGWNLERLTDACSDIVNLDAVESGRDLPQLSPPFGMLRLRGSLRHISEQIARTSPTYLNSIAGIVKRAGLQGQTTATDARGKPIT